MLDGEFMKISDSFRQIRESRHISLEATGGNFHAHISRFERGENDLTTQRFSGPSTDQKPSLGEFSHLAGIDEAAHEKRTKTRCA